MPFYGGRWQQTLLLGEGERIRMRIRLYGAMRHQNRPKLPGRDDHDLVAGIDYGGFVFNGRD